MNHEFIITTNNDFDPVTVYNCPVQRYTCTNCKLIKLTCEAFNKIYYYLNNDDSLHNEYKENIMNCNLRIIKNILS